jgi:hypothetical protein
MPIRINLLAESQATEELRRRDPVKRAIYVAVCFVVMVLVWISSLQVKIMADNSRLGNLEARKNSHTNEYLQILVNKKKLQDVHDNLTALNTLAADRFLQATLLNSLMHSTVDGIQVTHLRTEQAYDLTTETKPAMNDSGKVVVPGKPATSTEKIKLIIEARDTSDNPGNAQINKFKDTLAHTAYFKTQQISTNEVLLKNLSTPQLDGDSGKAYVLFSLECLYPEKIR